MPHLLRVPLNRWTMLPAVWLLTVSLTAGRIYAAEPQGPLPVKNHQVPLSFTLETFAENALSGGPGKDGIPAIDRPRFVDAGQADRFLDRQDIVFGVSVNGEAKAYPQKILVWHEIVNDRVGDENVSVTYCPLTGTAIGFKRGQTTLGVSGNLVNSNLIMYDRATDSRWPQVLGTAVRGPYQGNSLLEFRVIWTTWERWRDVWPDTAVLSTNTGYFRDYNRDPYGSYNPVGGYYREDAPTFFPVLNQDKRLPPKEVVMGARTEAGAIAFRKESLRTKKMMDGFVRQTRFAAFYDPVLDTAYIYENPNDKRFTPQHGGRYGNGNGSYSAGEIPLPRVNTFDAMWFAWIAFYPDTAVYD